MEQEDKDKKTKEDYIFVSKKSQKALETGNILAIIDSLTALQYKFCEEYLVDMKPQEACIRAGYKAKHPNRVAYLLLNNPAVRAVIDHLQAERLKNSKVTKDYVLRKITATLEKAEDSSNHTAVLRAAELLARHLGMFVDRTEISGPDGKAIELEQKKVKEQADDFINLIDKTAKNTDLKVVK